MILKKAIQVSLFILMLVVSIKANAVDVNDARLSVKISQNNSLLEFVTRDKVKNVVFTRFNDLWVIFTDKKVELNIEPKLLAKFGISQVEELIMKNNKGYRFRFEKQVPDVNFFHDYENRTVTINLVKKGSKVDVKRQRKPRSIKFRVDSEKNNDKIKNLYLDATFILDYAYSLQTGEKYLVAISSDSRLHFRTKLVDSSLYFLPTHSGAAMISEKGEFLTITDENKVELTDDEDLFFSKSVSSNLQQNIDKLFYNTGVLLIEKQLRDYTVFDRQVESFKPSKNFDGALGQLNNALDTINKINYLKYNKKLEPVSMKVEGADVIESGIIDQSSEDDGFFEISRQAEEELNTIEEEEVKDVLVPDFSKDNLALLMKILRLESTKQPSMFKKEKVNLKRMQVSAFKEYYAEILDLSKLTRLDISGEFPSSNKGLALFTLANAKMDRCKVISQLPEKHGSIYTKDIKLWKAYCLVKQEKFELALEIFQNDFSRIQTYPKHIKADLILAYSKALQGVEQYEKSTETLLDLLDDKSIKIEDEIHYTLAVNYLYSNEPELAEETFKQLVFSPNKIVRYQARLEYLNLLLQYDEADRATITKALDELRFDFRDNDTELEATKILASVYMQEDELKKAMELYKYISIYFAKTKTAKKATETLFNIFNNLFSNQQVVTSDMNKIDKLALFYDFIELTPSDHEGSGIITNIVADLMSLGLYDNAIKLLTIQLNYKTKNEDIAEELGEKLAELYLKTGQLKNSLKTLILTQKNVKDINYTTEAKIIKSKVLIQFGRSDSAAKLLSTIKYELKAKYLLAGIYWKNNDNDKIIKTLENIFLGKKVDLDEDGIINLSYLMVAYSLNGQTNKLKQIKSLYAKELEKVDLDSKLDFLLKLAGEDINIEKNDSKLLDVWQNVINIDSKLDKFLVDYKNQVIYREALKARDLETLAKQYPNRL